MASAFENNVKVQGVLYYGVIAVLAIYFGYLLAEEEWMVIPVLGGILWLLTLPYHSKMAIYLSIVTFSSALILPFFPGRPYFWEFSALLGWSGIILTVFLRQHRKDCFRLFEENRWLFLGVIGYCAVLIYTMYFRGIGLRILGSGQMGGRFYFQQLVCAIFPFLFAVCPLTETTLRRLFALQCILSLTFVLSDFVFSKAPKNLFFLLQFFELPGDAINFEAQAERFGIRRYQSLAFASLGISLLLMIKYELREFLGRRGIFLLPLAAVVLALGAFSGHRYLFMIVGLTVFFVSYAQRFMTVAHNTILAILAAAVLVFLYAFANQLPLATQRAVSILPGINIGSRARDDAAGTLGTRRILFAVGLQMAPQYYWLGRGFGQSATADHSLDWDPTAITQHLNKGTFYNGFIGLLVNTGLPGTFFMLMFMGGTTSLALRVIRHLRTYGSRDEFSRFCGVISGLWMANVLAFLFLHGDSEYAMKTFSLQAGLLLLANDLLRRRVLEQELIEAETTPIIKSAPVAVV